MTSACSTLDAEAPGDGEHGDGGGEVDVELGAPVVDELVDQRVDGLLDPVGDPPLRLGRHERRLHQRAVPAVLRAAHGEDAVEHARFAGVDALVGRVRREEVAVAERGVARLEAERREVRTVGVRQPLEEPVTRVVGELVHDAGVDRTRLAQRVPLRERVVGVAAARRTR